MRVVVFHLSGVHLGYIGCYGSDWLATPNLDRLAAAGVVFDRHFADRPAPHDVRGSHFTGRLCFPLPTGNGPALAAPSLPQVLRNNGIKPVILEAAAFPDRELGRWKRSHNPLCWINWPPLNPPWNADLLAPYFLEDETEPLSPWLDPPTGPFAEVSGDRERLQHTYAAAMSFFDDQLGKMLDQIEDLDDVLICVTASSGFALGEHGYIGSHRAWLHEEVVHVPLILRSPRSAEAGLRVSALTQPVDLPATILAVLELPPVETQGFNLLPLLEGEIEQVRPYACSGLAVGDSIEWSMRTPEWAFLLPLSTPPDDPPRLPQLFVKPDDRWDVNDVRQQNFELSEQLEKDLRAFVARTPASLSGR